MQTVEGDCGRARGSCFLAERRSDPIYQKIKKFILKQFDVEGWQALDTTQRNAQFELDMILSKCGQACNTM